MTDYRLDGMRLMAEYLGVSVETLRRWRKKPEGAFIEVGSSGCCEFGQAAWSFESSLDNLQTVIEAKTSEERRQAALKRWSRPTDPSSGQVL